MLCMADPKLFDRCAQEPGQVFDWLLDKGVSLDKMKELWRMNEWAERHNGTLGHSVP